MKRFDCYCDYAGHDSDQLEKPYLILIMEKRVIMMIVRWKPLMVKPHGMLKNMQHIHEISLCKTPAMIAYLKIVVS